MRRDLTTFRRFGLNPFQVFQELDKEIRDSLHQPEYSYGPKWDILDKDTHFLISMDVPGVPKEDINIVCKDGVLSISGHRKTEFKEGDYVERSYGQFKKSLSIPEGVNEDDIMAHYENGILNLLVPKAKEKETKKIEISTEKKGLWENLIGTPLNKINAQESESEKTKQSTCC